MQSRCPKTRSRQADARIGDPFSEGATNCIRSVIKADRRLAPDLPKRDCRFKLKGLPLAG